MNAECHSMLSASSINNMEHLTGMLPCKKISTIKSQFHAKSPSFSNGAYVTYSTELVSILNKERVTSLTGQSTVSHLSILLHPHALFWRLCTRAH